MGLNWFTLYCGSLFYGNVHVFYLEINVIINSDTSISCIAIGHKE